MRRHNRSLTRQFALSVVVLAVGAALLAVSPATGGRHATAAAAQGRGPATVRLVADLATQVRALQKQVKTLQTRVKTLSNEISVNYEGDGCLAALTTDALQATWLVLDQVSAATTSAKTYFGPQTPIDDKGACADLASPEVPRVRPAAGVAPTIGPFNALIAWLHG